MRILKRFLERLAVVGLGIVAIWLIVFVFRITDSRVPTILALSLVYALAAYVILPRVVRMNLKIMQRKSVPSFTVTGDGLPGDPVNLVLIGELDKLRAAFAAAGWTEADRLGLRSSWRMVVAFVFNRPYPGRPVQHALSVRARSGRGLPEGDRRQSAQAPPRPLLGAQHGAGGGDPRNARVLAQHRPPAARCAGAVGGRRDKGHRHLADPVHLPDHPPDRRRR